VAASPVAAGKLAIPVTISIGVSQFDGKESMDRLIGRADEALYAAKQGGRNRVDMA
jgi:diguanylate cyclase (GGDEF)-like protein